MDNVKLYKYRPVVSQEQLAFTLDLIRERKMFLGTPHYFNDPFDAFNYLKLNDTNKKILSLSKSPDSKLLWAYYGGWYAGVMIEIEIDLSIHPFQNIKEIKYSDDEEELTNSITKKDFFTKSKEFCHEQEWRLVFEIEHNFIQMDPSMLKSITLGPSLSHPFKEQISLLCCEESIKIYEYKMENGVPLLNEKIC